MFFDASGKRASIWEIRNEWNLDGRRPSRDKFLSHRKRKNLVYFILFVVRIPLVISESLISVRKNKILSAWSGFLGVASIWERFCGTIFIVSESPGPEDSENASGCLCWAYFRKGPSRRFWILKYSRVTDGPQENSSMLFLGFLSLWASFKLWFIQILGRHFECITPKRPKKAHKWGYNEHRGSGQEYSQNKTKSSNHHFSGGLTHIIAKGRLFKYSTPRSRHSSKGRLFKCSTPRSRHSWF